MMIVVRIRALLTMMVLVALIVRWWTVTLIRPHGHLLLLDPHEQEQRSSILLPLAPIDSFLLSCRPSIDMR
jgi:hypothetical protein